jgi:hypothetical protein
LRFAGGRGKANVERKANIDFWRNTSKHTKSIAKPCIVPTISINLSINRLPNNTVLNLPLKQRRKLVIEFLRKHPQETTKTRSRRLLQKGGQLTAREARHKIAQKYAKKRAKEEAIKQRNWQKIFKAEKTELHKRSVAARKTKRLRKKEAL